MMELAVAKALAIVTVQDSTGADVEVQIYQHENGGLFGIDASFLAHGGNFEEVSDVDDGDVMVLDPFSYAPQIGPGYKVLLQESKDHDQV